MTDLQGLAPYHCWASLLPLRAPHFITKNRSKRKKTKLTKQGGSELCVFWKVCVINTVQEKEGVKGVEVYVNLTWDPYGGPLKPLWPAFSNSLKIPTPSDPFQEEKHPWESFFCAILFCFLLFEVLPLVPLAPRTASSCWCCKHLYLCSH
jgi:hypothetical protein